jgi:hypothetical protein
MAEGSHAREQRLKAALRENLRRRKTQLRLRQADEDKEVPPDAASADRGALVEKSRLG